MFVYKIIYLSQAIFLINQNAFLVMINNFYKNATLGPHYLNFK